MTLTMLDPIVEDDEDMATVGEEVAGLAVHVANLDGKVTTIEESVRAVHRRLDARPSWAVAAFLAGQSTVIGVLATYVVTHAPK